MNPPRSPRLFLRIAVQGLGHRPSRAALLTGEPTDQTIDPASIKYLSALPGVDMAAPQRHLGLPSSDPTHGGSEELIAFIMSAGSAMRALMPAFSLACARMADSSASTASMPLTALVT